MFNVLFIDFLSAAPKGDIFTVAILKQWDAISVKFLWIIPKQDQKEAG